MHMFAPIRPGLLPTLVFWVSLSSGSGCAHHPAAPEYVDRSAYLQGNETPQAEPSRSPSKSLLESDLHRTAQPSQRAQNPEALRLWPDHVQMRMQVNCSGGLFRYGLDENRSNRLCFEGESERARQNLGLGVTVTSF